MGSRGPVPKRSTARAGHVTKAEKPQRAPAVTSEPPPSLADADPGWHPIATDWFESLSESGQSQFFQASDWAAARFVAEAMSRNLTAGRFSGQLFSSVWSAMSELLTTEGARRRVRLEIEQVQETGEDPAKVAVMDRYRALQSG